MPKTEYRKVLPFSAQKLFDLVLDIESYPKFLPWCVASKIVANDNQVIIADLTVEFKVFKEQYRSEVRFVPYSRIDTEAVSGPFKYLTSGWRFEVISDSSTEISFYIDFELNLSIANIVMNMLFEDAANKMFHAFEERARKIYKN